MGRVNGPADPGAPSRDRKVESREVRRMHGMECNVNTIASLVPQEAAQISCRGRANRRCIDGRLAHAIVDV